MSVVEKGKRAVYLAFKTKVKGTGIVNFDAYETVKRYQYYPHDNVKPAKTTLQRTKAEVKGELKEKLIRSVKISSGSFKQAIFANKQQGMSGLIFSGLGLKGENIAKLVAQNSYLTRGYLFTSDKNDKSTNTLKRKSVVSITDQFQVNTEERLKLDFCSAGGVRSKTSIFQIETIGHVEYEGYGNFNLSEAGFVSCDITFDRQALSEGDVPSFLKAIEERHGVKVGHGDAVKSYKKTHSELPLCEKGVVLPEKVVQNLVVDFFTDLQKTAIFRSGGEAIVESVEVWVIAEGESYSKSYDTPCTFEIKHDSVVSKVLEEGVFSKYSVRPQYELATKEEETLSSKYIESKIALMKKEEKEEKEDKEDKKSSKKSLASDDTPA